MDKTVSIIIPCRNEEKYIKKCITSFSNQSYPQNLLKIIVSDGMSTDKTREIIKKLQKDNSNVILLENKELTAPKGMNLGIRYSDSEIVIIFGAHAFADKDFVKESVKAVVKENVGCAGGVITTINETNKGAAIAESMSCPFGVGNALFRFADKECYVDTVGFGAYKKEVLNKIGYFDDELVRNQDDELNYRVIKSGAKILLSPKIKSTYYGRSDFKKLWRQYFQYGFWKVRVIQKHKKPAALRHLIPMMFVLFLGPIGILSLIFKLLRIPYLCILSLYILLDLIFSIKISLKNKWSYLCYLIVTFPILHLSYGIGFLLGIINFYMMKSSKLEEKNKKMSR
ncbi:glycosyltransferase family 2 protein [Clostridium sp. BJN0001]|uniref:glycosyltransferase family 2 protein n=1 Tax=Clostridium sp. BJN0001 TaxID=2930219 RepID=UPI001FD3065E|nr:glycosyltransferase family 2 protein [Clostridium sp. BJN0001]